MPEMKARSTHIAFLVLVLVQALHSIEEYVGRLWEVFPPARYLTGLVSNNREKGFLLINIGLFLFGAWCWYFPVRLRTRAASAVITTWVIIETINAIGHPAWSLYTGGYTPGLITALMFIPVLVVLVQKQWFSNQST